MSRSSPSAIHLSMALQRCGRQLLHQQCWLWGQDVRRPEGNLLLAYGFNRLRAPDGSAASTQYTLQIPLEHGSNTAKPSIAFLREPCMLVRLWGFGIFFGTEEEGIFLNRYEFAPRSAAAEARFFQASEMAVLERARCLRVLPGALHWISSYESWVQENYGAEYRKRCMREWKKRSLPCDELPRRWRELGDDVNLAIVRSTGLKKISA